MGVLLKREKYPTYLSKITKLALVSLLISLAAALIDTIWTIYLDSFLHSEVYVGLLSTALIFISIISYFIFIPIIESSDKTKIYSLSVLLIIITYLLFSINTNFYLFIVLAGILTIFYTLRISSYGIIIKTNSPKKILSKNEGFIYAIRNIAWVIGPLIASFILATSNINRIFILSAFVSFLSLMLFKMSNIKKPPLSKKTHSSIIKNFRDFFKNKNRFFIYTLTGGISAWWSFIYLFIPLLILRSALPKTYIGYFLFAIALPLIFLEYPLSKIANKKGFKVPFLLGFAIPAVLSVLCFFISNIYLILFLLVLASSGMAFLEPTTEAYFFNITTKHEENRFYSPYNTSLNFGALFSRLLASIILIFLPFKFLFLFYSLLMFALAIFSLKTKRIIENHP